MPDPNMMKIMIVIEYDILPEIEIILDIPLILPFDEQESKKKKYIHSII